MAGHSKFKNIQHRKNAQDKKRSIIFGNLIKAIKVASRLGGGTATNHALRTAINNARKANVPKDRIEAAIVSTAEMADYEEVRYEAYAPHGIALIIEAITDNRNRAAAEIRGILNKKGGSLASAGSVTYLFDHLGLLVYQDSEPDAILEVTLDSGASDFESSSGKQLIFCPIVDLSKIQDKLAASLGREVDFCRLAWRPKDKIKLDDDKRQVVLDLISLLQDNSDVQYVDSNLFLPEREANKDV